MQAFKHLQMRWHLLINIQTMERQRKRNFHSEGKMYANRDKAGGWEDFEVIELPFGKVALRGCNGKYVSADMDRGGQLICNRDAISRSTGQDGWECFKIIDLGNNKRLFRKAE